MTSAWGGVATESMTAGFFRLRHQRRHGDGQLHGRPGDDRGRRPDQRRRRPSFAPPPFDDGAVQTELDRVVEGCNTTGTIIRFRTQAAIAVGAADARYRMDFGNALGTGAPENPANVYAFYDDFQDGNDAGWTKKGTFAVVNDGGNYIYRYSTGGANWALAYATVPGVSDLDYTAKIRAAANTCSKPRK